MNIKELPSLTTLPKDILNICLSYLTEDDIYYMEGKWDKFDEIEVYNIAAKKGWLDLLIWAHEKEDGLENETPNLTCSFAAASGQLDVLKWLKLHGYTMDNSYIWTYAAKYGYAHLDILKWVHEQESQKNLQTDWNRFICDNAVQNNNIEVLKWAILNDCPINENMCYWAQFYKNNDALKWIEINCCKCKGLYHKN